MLHNSSARKRGSSSGKRVSLSVIAVATLIPGALFANGLYENRSWQFDTSADKANKAAIADMIERKRGGYYDGFDTNVYNTNTTNIGTQINCNNVADATGNVADNTQDGSAATATPASTIGADATGNEASFDTDSSGTATTDGTDGGTSDQDNTGDVSAEVVDSDSTTTVSDINVGDSAQDLLNTQDNSGDQYATIEASTACDLDGATLTGNVDFDLPDGPLN